MIVAFVGIVAPALTNPPMWVCAATASVCGILTWGWANQSGLIISGLVGVAAGVLMEKIEENKDRKVNV